MKLLKRKSVEIKDIKAIENTDSGAKFPFFTVRVQAGFPSPGDDYIERNLDLNELLIKNPSATFFVKVEGDSMKDAGISSGDTLIVDRAIEAKDKSIVIASINGELTVKRVWIANKKVFLKPENDDFSPIEITEEMDFNIWGVVTYVVSKV
jgi:DNA polymerase V|tara:strand:+ start:176 stop:628 length:453 start_codon:yes stop_codon:yes gene_type:complete